MIPTRLQQILKEVLCLKFDEEPAYDRIIHALSDCLRSAKSNKLRVPGHGGYRSSRSVDKNREEEKQAVVVEHAYEWKRNIANQVRL